MSPESCFLGQTSRHAGGILWFFYDGKRHSYAHCLDVPSPPGRKEWSVEATCDPVFLGAGTNCSSVDSSAAEKESAALTFSLNWSRMQLRTATVVGNSGNAFLGRRDKKKRARAREREKARKLHQVKPRS